MSTNCQSIVNYSAANSKNLTTNNGQNFRSLRSCLGIQSLRPGFAVLKEFPGAMTGISRHTFNLAAYAVFQLTSIKHNNGTRVVRVYGDEENYLIGNIREQGGIVNFNLLDENGALIGFSALKTLCDLQNIILRFVQCTNINLLNSFYF